MSVIARRSLMSLLVGLCSVAVGAAMAPPSVSDIMREALRMSADNYVAALVEVVGERECWNDGERTLCADTVAVVERFAARSPEGRDFPPQFRLVAGDSEEGRPAPGTRYLVIAIPLPGRGVYGAKAMFLDPTTSDVRSWKTQVEAALAGAQTGK